MGHLPEFWFFLAGGVLAGVGLLHFMLEKIPLSTAMIYLIFGVVLGPMVTGALSFDLYEHSELVEHITEIVILASVFTAGLIAKPRLSDRKWRTPLRLAFIGVGLGVLFLAVAGKMMGLTWGLAILAGGILAPTDPVLASEVQVDDEHDADHLKFSLTAEAGMNDGSSFPFIFLGLGIMGLHDIGTYGVRWAYYDVGYKFIVALVVGAGFSYLATLILNHVHARRKDSVALHDFLGLGLLFFIYGACLYLDAYGFIAAFAAGLVFRRTEVEVQADHKEKIEADSPNHTATKAIIDFNNQLERFGEFACVFWIGVALSFQFTVYSLLAPLLIFLIRPVTVFLCTLGVPWSRSQRRLACWFGIRGVGSIFYLAYAIHHAGTLIPRGLTDAILLTVALSVMVHGTTATPLMRNYRKFRFYRT